MRVVTTNTYNFDYEERGLKVNFVLQDNLELLIQAQALIDILNRAIREIKEEIIDKKWVRQPI